MNVCVFPGILSVLSLSSESMLLASELPKVSYVKAIDIWLLTCLLFGFSSLVEYAVVQVSSYTQTHSTSPHLSPGLKSLRIMEEESSNKGGAKSSMTRKEKGDLFCHVGVKGTCDALYTVLQLQRLLFCILMWVKFSR